MKRKLLARLLLLAILLGVTWLVRQRQQAELSQSKPTQTTTQGPKSDNGKPAPKTPVSEVPAYALEVLKHIRNNGVAPDGYVGGREFLNREKHLRPKEEGGKRIRYSEWDVHPKVQGQNRGAERLVTGSDHSAWYTADHYKSFIKIDL